MRTRVRRASAIALLMILAAGPQAQNDPLEIPRERVLAIDMRVLATGPFRSNPAPVTAPGVVWQQAVRADRGVAGTSDGLRVHLQLDAAGTGPWSIRLKDEAGNEVERVNPGLFSGGASDLWTDEVRGGVAMVEIWMESAGAPPMLTIERYAYRVVPSEQQAIWGEDERKPIQEAPVRVRRLGPPVARLRFMIAGVGQATCTGFLVGKGLLLTNQHCISNDEEMRSAFADFGYDDAGMTPLHVRAASIVAVSVGLDYSLIRLADDPSAQFNRLYFSIPAPAADGQPLAIIQHPSGLPKQVSIANCRIMGLQRVGAAAGDVSDFGHTCDTFGGSSGSPVINWNTGRVIGLHHFGFHQGVRDPVNQAVHVQRIFEHLKTKDEAAHAEVTAQPPI